LDIDVAERLAYFPFNAIPRFIFGQVDRDSVPVRVRTFANARLGIFPAEVNVSDDVLDVALCPGGPPTAHRIRVLAIEGGDVVLEGRVK